MTAPTADKPRRTRTPSGITLLPRTAAVCVAAALALFVPGIVAFGPVFGGLDGYVAAGGGVLVGVAIGVLAVHLRWGLAATVAAVLGAYLLFGGPLALRQTTLFGVLPTPETLLRLAPLTVQAWRDLLTVTPPAGAFIGPAVVPYLSGLVLGTVAALLVLSQRRYLWTLAPTLGLLVIGIAWGLDAAPRAAFLGVGFGVVALVWATWRRLAGRATEETDHLAEASGRLDVRRLGAAALAVLVAGGVALGVSPLLGGSQDRQVLRQVVQPPLNLADYPSPLTGYRYLEADLKEVSLFTVAGLPAGARVRLATMDAYDGHVYNVADASAGFLRIGNAVGVGGNGFPGHAGRPDQGLRGRVAARRRGGPIGRLHRPPGSSAG